MSQLRAGRPSASKPSQTIAALKAEQSPVKRLNVEIPHALKAQAEHLAIDKGMSLKDVVVKALEEYLKRK